MSTAAGVIHLRERVHIETAEKEEKGVDAAKRGDDGLSAVSTKDSQLLKRLDRSRLTTIVLFSFLCN